MTFAAKAAAVFGYRVLPTVLLSFATYLAIIVAIVVTDVLPAVPRPDKQGGLNVTDAYNDLQHITAHPHPYNSHANDDVRAYILSRLTALAEKYPHVHIVDDLTSNKTWLSTDLGRGHGTYFEGTNLLVKVDGTAGAPTGGVLFSAHYDSVATACGATDDGMGLVTLVQLVKYFAEQRLPRTAVFNINNGEEDGLHGAHAFLAHPWAGLVDTFLNLEGAAAGGRPILFRATSATPVRAARDRTRTPHPHANVLSSDVFARGLIKSGTDFSVYAGPGAGMAGLDLAFYKGRSVYHTRYDCVPYTVGGERSLWSMMEAARGIGEGLLSEAVVDKVDLAEVNDDAVYFDLFKSTIIVFRLKNLLTFNVISLIAGPTLLALLLFCEKFFRSVSVDDTRPLLRDDPSSRPSSQTHSRNHSGQQTLPAVPRFGRHRPSTPIPGYHVDDDAAEEEFNARRHRSEAVEEQDRAGHSPRVHAMWRHAKFWVALMAVVALQVLLGWAYTAINPFAIYSSPYLILFSFASSVYLTLIYVLTLPSSLPFVHSKAHPAPSTSTLHPAQHQKHTIFLHLYTFTWLLLLLGTLGITLVHPGIGGGYLLSAWNACVGAACVVAVVEGLLAPEAADKEAEAEERYEELGAEGAGGVDENTPLMWREQWARGVRRDNSARGEGAEERRIGANAGGGAGDREGEGLATWWWIAQFLISVPVPVILFGHIATILLDALPQTLADGGAPWLVYALTSVLAVVLVLPLAPFAYKLQPSRVLTLFVLAIFVGTTLYAWLAFPFSIDAPLKIFFRQTVGFPRQQNASHAGARVAHYGLRRRLPQDAFAAAAAVPPTVITSLTGPTRYLHTHLIPALPSSRGKLVWCTHEETRPHLVTCEWESDLVPTPGSHSALRGGGIQGRRDGDGDGDDKMAESGTDTPHVGQFFKAEVRSTGPHSGFISIKGRNTRACRLYFDSAPIHKYTVRHLGTLAAAVASGSPPPPATWPAAPKPRNDDAQQAPLDAGVDSESVSGSSRAGIKELRLWSRTWEQELGVEFSWMPPLSDNHTTEGHGGSSKTLMEGRIACEWAEYESGMLDNGAVLSGVGSGHAAEVGVGDATKARQAQSGAKIPAMEELLAYLPDWAVVTKASDGLVEAWTPFVIW